ncbi:hypothetical protein [Bacillus sp. 1NLA3E]|uniref:hypothetical protein n=1 Tax=Bacillus sp. 1NLA3E TaxID=666686 RepID=UPI000247F2FB|nr:hypothetical protein [Bacillus sp. 1NLA3E]AGK54082.1 hypothetical protein B1NLA3E_11660 [Bacillus sp. 1NLA3E]
MKKQKATENLFSMVQTDMKAKKFRKDYPVSEKLSEEMVNVVFRDFMMYAINQYYDDENLSILQEFLEEHSLKVDKRQSLLDNLFWWKVLCYSGGNNRNSCIEDYIFENFSRFRNRPLITSWLRECDKAAPKFYFIGHQFNDRLFAAVDILTEKPLSIIVCDPNAISPKNGELAVGTLLPLGGDLYFPIVDFYHFDYEAREAMSSCLHYHYYKHLKNSTMHEAFLHVLSVMLQIEGIIASERNVERK